MMIEKNGNFKIIEIIKNKQKIAKLIIKSALDNPTNRTIPEKNINE